MVTEILLGVTIVLLAGLLVLFWRREVRETRQMESAFTRTWARLGIDEKVGRLELYARDIRNDYRDLERLLRVPTARGALGEIGLESILADQLPPEVYGIRRSILNGRIPDAYIASTAGIICIDSKFPLDNYRKLVEGGADLNGHKKRFLRDVQHHLQKVAQDYICPWEGSAEFAFVYIPAEGVYWYLVTEAADLLRNYTKQGVQVVSPLTLSHKVELVKAGIYTRRLTEEAEQIRAEIGRLARDFKEVDEQWRVYRLHLSNLINKTRDVDAAYKTLRDEFHQVARLSDE